MRGQDELWIAFSDPCSLPSHPGWPLRNLLSLVMVHLPKIRALGRFTSESLRVLCYREQGEVCSACCARTLPL